MPNTKSAQKRLRQSKARNARNRGVKSDLRTQVNRVRAAVKSADVETSEAELRLAAKKLDKAAARNVIHANKAARTKSRLAAAIRKLKTPE